MRTLMIAAVVATMAFGGTAADAQRIGPRGKPADAAAGPADAHAATADADAQSRQLARRAASQSDADAASQSGRLERRPVAGRRPVAVAATMAVANGAAAAAGATASAASGGPASRRRAAGTRYNRVKRGKRLTGYWLSPNFIINDWQVYGLGAPPSGYYWTRYYNDAVLIDRDGQVYDSRDGIDWDRYQGGYGYDDQYGDGGRRAGPGLSAKDRAMAPAIPRRAMADRRPRLRPTPTRPAAVTLAALPMGPPPRIAYGETYYVSPGSVVTVTMPGAVTTTTTTTTEYIYERRYVAKRKVWRKPVRKWRPKPRCTCAPRPILGS